VLARAATRYYAVPVTYQGRFQRRPRIFSGARQLEQAAITAGRRASVFDDDENSIGVELVVRVVYLNVQENLSVKLGDILRVDTSSTSREAAKDYIICEM
jgi:hypothetical protein